MQGHLFIDQLLTTKVAHSIHTMPNGIVWVISDYGRMPIELGRENRSDVRYQIKKVLNGTWKEKDFFSPED